MAQRFPITPALVYAARHRNRFRQVLFQLLRIPSVSTDPARRGDVRRCAGAVAALFRRAGFEARVARTDGHPVVLAEAGPSHGPTALVYGHYDVQPAEGPEWRRDPFDPWIRGGNVVARGASDNKGQFLAHLFAAESWIRGARGLPLRLRFLIEGEEEIGSPHLEPFLRRHREALRADWIVVSDGHQMARGMPAMTYGFRGLAALEVVVEGPGRDLHSGTFGGAVDNPARVLASLLASLHDPDGRVAIPGFEDDVRPLSRSERRSLADLRLREKDLARDLGVARLWGDPRFSAVERRWCRPTMEINGIVGGYTGAGMKTVLPARASAKISARLVPDQNPEWVLRAIETHLRRKAPPTVRISFRRYQGSPALVVPTEGPSVRAAARALEAGFGRRPVFIREGGTLPILPDLRDLLGIRDILLFGFGLLDDRAHGPNEKFSLADFHRGIRTSMELWKELASLPPRSVKR